MSSVIVLNKQAHVPNEEYSLVTWLWFYVYVAYFVMFYNTLMIFVIGKVEQNSDLLIFKKYLMFQLEHEWTVFSPTERAAADWAWTLWLTHLHLIRKRRGREAIEARLILFFEHSLLSDYANRKK